MRYDPSMSDTPAFTETPADDFVELDTTTLINVLNDRLLLANRDGIIAETRAAQAEARVAALEEENLLLRATLRGPLDEVLDDSDESDVSAT